jgi:TPP-dependent indolepyruvate ferredoxin oxidoreductase alpha subunit
MGGSTALALGAHLAGVEDAWAVTGDFSFVAAGHLGLAEAYAREAPLKTLLLVNGEAAATGGQPLPRRALDRALAPYADDVRWARGDDGPALAATLREAAAHAGPRIVAVEV